MIYLIGAEVSIVLLIEWRKLDAKLSSNTVLVCYTYTRNFNIAGIICAICYDYLYGSTVLLGNTVVVK